MYRVSPFTYLVSGMLSTGISGAPITCASNEYVTMDPPSGQTCGEYLSAYNNATGSYIVDAGATSNCQLCSSSSTDSFLASVNIYYSDAWRNFGLMWVFIIFNICAAVFLYWLARVPKGARKAKKE